MIALSIALGLVGLAALWTARDVVLRLHRGSEARAAIDTAEAARREVEAARAALDAAIAKHGATLEKVRSELESVKAHAAFGGGRR